VKLCIWRSAKNTDLFENRVPRTFVPKRGEETGGWKELLNEEIHVFYSSLNTIKVIKSRTVRWVGHVVHTWRWEIRKKFWLERLKVRDHSEDLDVDINSFVRTSCCCRGWWVRLCLWTAATSGPIVQPQIIYEYGEPRQDDIDRGTEELGEKSVLCHFVYHKPHTNKPGFVPHLLYLHVNIPT
jgi:hypothetical protein